MIVDGLGLAHVVVGADFCFGKGRKGTAEDLVALGNELGFGVTIAPLVTGGDQQVSSTNIRNALSDGRPRDAAAMLGHWHRIEGPVIGGEQRGRELGFPTANMSIDGLHPRSSASMPSLLTFWMAPMRAAIWARCRRAPDVWREHRQYRDLSL